MLPLRILATGKALPARQVTSAQLDAELDRRIGYVENKSGIKHRYYAGAHESQSDLAAQALKNAFSEAALRPSDVDLLIAACGVQEQALPNTASRILEAAGFPAGVPGIDINASCISFVSALSTAAALLNAGQYRRIAIVSADLASRGLDFDEPEASLIFGDGAAAVIVEKGASNQGVVTSKFETYPEGKAFCEIRAGGTRSTPRLGVDPKDFLFRMDGKRVFKLASKVMPGFMDRLLTPTGLTLDDIDILVPHQASHLGMQHVLKRLGIPAERVIDIYATHGNQVAASIPTALHEAFITGKATLGKRVLLLGTAAGLTVGGLVLDL